MTIHTIVISDIHLCEAMPGNGLWLRYRQKKYFPDTDFSQLVEYICATAEPKSVELVLNGDIFDFDVLPIIDGEVLYDDCARSEEHAIETMKRILQDHTVFIAALRKLHSAGHRLVFISGNHDTQLIFEGVRTILRTKISHNIIFRNWFYISPNKIHIEHGNQYDSYTCYRYPAFPFDDTGKNIQPTLGSLTCRHLVSRMGFFNPHVDNSFMLSFSEYISHWVQHYFLTKRSLIFAWMKGSVRTFVTTWKSRTHIDERLLGRMLEEAYTETKISRELLRKHILEFAKPSEDARIRVLRELHLDYLTLCIVVCALMVFTLTFSGEYLMLKTAIASCIVLSIYHYILPKNESLNSIFARVNACERNISDIYKVPAIVFGHTHAAFGIWQNEKFIGNSGTWTPRFLDIECTKPLSTGRPVIWLTRQDAGNLSGGLYQWENGVLKKNHHS